MPSKERPSWISTQIRNANMNMWVNKAVILERIKMH